MTCERKNTFMANRIKKKEETKSSYQDNVALIMGVFTLAVLCVLPLVFRDYYFNILETKYQFYCLDCGARCYGRLWACKRKNDRMVFKIRF